jgi:2-isopropylmalate synthase
LHAASHLGGSASASVKLTHEDGHSVSEAAIGDGPVDAVLRAVERATGESLRLADFHVRAVSEGGDAQGQAVLEVRHGERQWRGQAYSTDIVEAAAQAALEVANRIARHAADANPATPKAASA